MDKIRQRLSDLGYAIYDAPAPVGSYVQCVRTGNLLHLSGGISVNGDDKYFGKVGQELTVEEGQAASDLLVEAFGEIGRHSRTAVGVSALPLNVAVEISMVVEVRD